MAKGKGGKSKGYISEGQRPSVRKSIRNANRSEYLQSADRALNQQKAYMQGKRVMITIANPDKKNTKERFIRVTGDQINKPSSRFGYII